MASSTNYASFLKISVPSSRPAIKSFTTEYFFNHVSKVPATVLPYTSVNRSTIPPHPITVKSEENNYIIDICLIVLGMFIIVINGYVISMFIRNKNLRTPSNLLLLNLACADLLTAAIDIPLQVASRMLNRKQEMNLTITRTAFASDIATILFAAITIQCLCSVVADRLIMLSIPSKYSTIVTKRNALIAIAAIWLMSSTISFSRIFWLHTFLSKAASDDFNTRHPLDTWYYTAGISLFFVTFVGMLLAFIIMCISLLRLGSTVSIRRNRGKLATKDARIRERKMLILFSVMFIVYVICWTPLVILRMVFVLGSKGPSISVTSFLTFLRYLVNLIDPLLYTFYKLEFWRMFNKDLRKLFKKIDWPSWCFDSDCQQGCDTIDHGSKELMNETKPMVLNNSSAKPLPLEDLKKLFKMIHKDSDDTDAINFQAPMTDKEEGNPEFIINRSNIRTGARARIFSFYDNIEGLMEYMQENERETVI